MSHDFMPKIKSKKKETKIKQLTTERTFNDWWLVEGRRLIWIYLKHDLAI